MSLSLLFLNILPLCALIGLGYFAGKRLKVEPHSLAGLAIFILGPVVNFGAVARLTLDPAYLALPVFVFVICVTVTLGSYTLARRFFSGNVANFIGMASSWQYGLFRPADRCRFVRRGRRRDLPFGQSGHRAGRGQHRLLCRRARAL